jgi:hypothetical protein
MLRIFETQLISDLTDRFFYVKNSFLSYLDQFGLDMLNCCFCLIPSLQGHQSNLKTG